MFFAGACPSLSRIRRDKCHRRIPKLIHKTVGFNEKGREALRPPRPSAHQETRRPAGRVKAEAEDPVRGQAAQACPVGVRLSGWRRCLPPCRAASAARAPRRCRVQRSRPRRGSVGGPSRGPRPRAAGPRRSCRSGNERSSRSAARPPAAARPRWTRGENARAPCGPATGPPGRSPAKACPASRFRAAAQRSSSAVAPDPIRTAQTRNSAASGMACRPGADHPAGRGVADLGAPCT